MSWDPTPWVIRGGRHSAEVGRLLAYATSSGSEGVIEPADLRVTALPVPGGKVRVNPGPCIIINRAGGASRQSYVARNAIAHDVDIAATGSGGSRRDMVIARIEDPQYEGQEPADYTTAQFVFTRVLQNVPASAIASPKAARDYLRTLNLTAIPLAAVTLPASTATVTGDMIKNLREVAMPRKERTVMTWNVTANGVQPLKATATAGEEWPKEADFLVDVPEWASVANIIITWGSIYQPNGANNYGNVWGYIGDPKASDYTPIVVPEGRYDKPDNAGVTRGTYMVAHPRAVPANMRGKTVPVLPYARIVGGGAAVAPIADAYSSVVVDIEFLESAD